MPSGSERVAQMDPSELIYQLKNSQNQKITILTKFSSDVL